MTAGEPVLVTGVGVGGGIRALTGPGLVLVGADADGLASGLQAVPVAYRVPRADDEAFIATLVDLCARDNAGWYFLACLPSMNHLIRRAAANGC